MRAIPRLLLAAGLIAAGAPLGGCDRIGNPFEVLGGGVPPPDEFAVIKRRPLLMPPSLGLPPPQPGAPSPLDPQPRQEAALALLGTPVPRAAPTQPATAGEAALLSSADAAAASSEVRVQLAQDQVADDAEWEPPTIFEVLGMRDPPPIDPAEQLEPVSEAQRLQRTGVPAPADPLATPPEEAEAGEAVEDDATIDGVRVFRSPRTTRRP